MSRAATRGRGTEAGNRGTEEEARQDVERLALAHDLDDETALRILRDRMTWRDWFLYDFLRYWYWLGAFMLVAFLLMQISWKYHVKDLTGLSGLALLGFALIILAFYAYKAVWPKGAFTEGWPAGSRLRKAIRRLRWRL